MPNNRYTEEQYAHAVRLVLEDGKSIKEASRLSGVKTISLYTRIAADPRWKLCRYNNPRTPSKPRADFAAHARLFSEFHKDCIVEHKMPVAEAIQVWNNEYASKDGYRPCTSRQVYYLWLNRVIKNPTPKNIDNATEPPVSSHQREVVALSVLLGVSETEIVARAVRRYKEEVLKTIHSL